MSLGWKQKRKKNTCVPLMLLLKMWLESDAIENIKKKYIFDPKLYLDV